MENVVKKLLSLGADEVEIRQEVSKIVRAPFKADEIGPISAAEKITYGIRVVVDKRIAYTYYSGTPDGLEAVAKKTLSVAKSLSKREDRPGLPDIKESSAVSDLYFDDVVSIVSGDYDPIMDIIKQVVDLANEQGVSLARNDLGFSEKYVRIVNSNGLDKEYKATQGSLVIQTLYEKGSYREFEIFRSLSTLDIEKVVINAANKAKDAAKAELIQTFSGDALFEPPISAELVEVMLARPINGELVLKGGSPLANKLGMEIASKEFNLCDDGTLKGGIGSAPFDDEGVPTEKTVIVEDGVLKAFIYDRYYGHKAGKTSTGNGFIGREGYPPSTSPSNIIVRPMKGTLEDMISSIDKGMMISSTIGARLSDPIGGIYNATVTLGYLIENGEIKKPVKGVVVNIPFRESLKEIRIGESPVRHYMNAYAPPIILPKATFAAK